jgi:hypothetical protein
MARVCAITVRRADAGCDECVDAWARGWQGWTWCSWGARGASTRSRPGGGRDRCWMERGWLSWGSKVTMQMQWARVMVVEVENASLEEAAGGSRPPGHARPLPPVPQI